MAQQLHRTPLYDIHVSLGGRMVSFAGWEMPIQYSSILDEAKAVRSTAGLFDVSHMGRFDIQGSGAAALLDRVFSVDVSGLRVGRARYGLICNLEGGIIDDCIAYRRADERFLLIPNASNAVVVLDWLTRWSADQEGVHINDLTSDYAMIAYQGPRAAEAMAELTPADLSAMRMFAAVETQVAGVEALLARTGYTGEDGFEMVVPRDAVRGLWRRLTDEGAIPCGLGARDVLRLEAGLPLHGNDITPSTNPFEAGLDRFVDAGRGHYIAGDALRRARDAGVQRRLVGFVMTERRIPRHGYSIYGEGGVIGEVTSGGHAPTLDTSIGLGYVPTSYATVGSRFHVDIRGRMVEAEVTEIPFYSRRRAG